MLEMILKYLPVLGVAISVNIILGLYNNISNIKETFEWRKLINGIIKAICVSASFVGLAYCFDATGTVIDVGVFDIGAWATYFRRAISHPMSCTKKSLITDLFD